MEFRKMLMITLYAEQKKRHRFIEQSFRLSKIHYKKKKKKNTGVGCNAFLQEIFPTQGSNWCLLSLLHCRLILYLWATREAPIKSLILYFPMKIHRYPIWPTVDTKSGSPFFGSSHDALHCVCMYKFLFLHISVILISHCA